VEHRQRRHPAEGKRVLIDDPNRFDGVKVIGGDEHVWRHTGRGDKYVTVIIDLTGIRDGTGPARLLDMVEGRSKQAFKTWLADRPDTWRDAVEVVAMDGFTGFKIATAEGLPDAVAVMDPFHVVRLAGDALDRCRRRVQQAIRAPRHTGRPALQRPPLPEPDQLHRQGPSRDRRIQTAPTPSIVKSR
jgi:transposase